MSGNVYITQVLLKRGNTTAASAYTGPVGELVIDTGLDTVRVQDGVTAGGAAILATNAQINTINANVAALGTYANATFGTSSFGNANVAIYLPTDPTITGLQSNAAVQATSINLINANLGAFETYANATFGTSSYGDSNVAAYLPTNPTILAINANVTAANAAISSLQANAAVQAGLIDLLSGNAATQNQALLDLTANAAAQSIELSTLLSNAAVQADELNILLSNAAVQADELNVLVSNAAAQATAINTISANIGSFYTYANIHFGDSNYGNANVAAYLPTDLTIGGLAANADSQQTQIGSLQANVTAANVQITNLWANAALQDTYITTLTANVAADAANIFVLQGNVVTLENSIIDTNSNVAAANAAIASKTVANLTNGAYTISLNSNGTLTFPDTSVQQTAFTSNVELNTVNFTASPIASYGTPGIQWASGFQDDIYGNTQVSTYLNSGSLETAWFHGNVTVGNLTVNGNVTYVNTQSYSVVDNIITMADGNPADTLDLGFAAHRTVGGTLQHTGLVRDASANNWKLFSNVVPAPGNTVDFTDAIYDDLIAGTVTGTDFKFANGISILSTVTGTYSNANVASYLVANPQAGTYSNTNVAAYLLGTISTGNVNVGSAMRINGTTQTIDTGNGSKITVGSRLDITGSAAGFGLVVSSPASFSSNITTTANVIAPNYLFANGVNILSTVTGGSGTYSNTNVAAYLTTATISTTGNISAANIVTTGATSGNISGANYVSANVFQVSTGIFWANGTAWSSTSGGTTYSNANVTAYLTAGNVSVGTAGFTVLPNIVAQFTSNVNSYGQVNMQNINSGTDATTEIVATANNGTDTIFFLDMGIAGNTYDNTSPSNSLGTIIWANDAYLYAQGNTSANVGGNLAIGTSTAGRAVTIFAGGINNSSNVATFANTGVTVYGNVTAANIITTGTYGNITGANVISANTVTVSRAITWANGTAYSVGSYSNSNVAAYLPTYTGTLAGSDITLSGGEWTGFTPTWYASTTPVSIGDGLAEGRYRILGKTVEVWMQVSMGSTTTFGTGEYKISLPVASRGLASAVLSLVMRDNGTRLYNSLAHNAYTSSSYWTSSNVTLFWDTGVVTNTAPFTWANGDWFIVSGTYEAA